MSRKTETGPRFWSKVDIKDLDDCWLWTANAPKGRGLFWINNTSIPAPRMSYILTYGEVPEGMDVLNGCGDSLCVNPSHLVVDRRRTNRNGTHKNAAKNFCPRGHEYDSIVETAAGPRRRCKICHSYQERIRRNIGTDTRIKEWEEVLKVFNYQCVYCGAPWEHMDHFVPLSKGGTHSANNVVPACADCNLSKGNKDPLDFIGCGPVRALKGEDD